MLRNFLGVLSLACPLLAQLATWTTPVARTDKPPVVSSPNMDAVCPDPKSGELPFFNLTFGDFDKVISRLGRVSLVFEACYAPNRPAIEGIANTLAAFLNGLRYADGELVPEIDIVAHSLGGLVVRSYLAGKQVDGDFRPPVSPRLRKVVFIGTPDISEPPWQHPTTTIRNSERCHSAASFYLTWQPGTKIAMISVVSKPCLLWEPGESTGHRDLPTASLRSPVDL